jgi:hypothetical protein
MKGPSLATAFFSPITGYDPWGPKRRYDAARYSSI